MAARNAGLRIVFSCVRQSRRKARTHRPHTGGAMRRAGGAKRPARTRTGPAGICARADRRGVLSYSEFPATAHPLRFRVHFRPGRAFPHAAVRVVRRPPPANAPVVTPAARRGRARQCVIKRIFNRSPVPVRPRLLFQPLRCRFVRAPLRGRRPVL